MLFLYILVSIILADEMIERIDGIYMPKQESHLARLEFRQYNQHHNEPALTYLANKRVLYNKGWPTSQDIPFLILEMMKGLAIQEGIAVDTTLDGLALSTQTNYTFHSDKQMDVSTTQPVQNLRMNEPSRYQNNLRASEPPTIQAMSGNPTTCYSCGQQGHMIRECPLKGQYSTRGGAAPAIMG